MTACDHTPAAHCQHINSLLDKIRTDSDLQHQEDFLQEPCSLAPLFIQCLQKFCNRVNSRSIHQFLQIADSVCRQFFQLLAIQQEIIWEYSHDHILLGEMHLSL